ncbi:hypothetical protein AAFF_G00203070 [Aldrovandia affinis]|uniref:Uncharacterized protein n=1 Tax=Aldrovandia affinis TaxID=143900 RepID=A0AAD7SX48_9TELE|nr:hypothetical protein AAFF_G00203070 [Aldrovandia affinis]
MCLFARNARPSRIFVPDDGEQTVERNALFRPQTHLGMPHCEKLLLEQGFLRTDRPPISPHTAPHRRSGSSYGEAKKRDNTDMTSAAGPPAETD